MRISCSAATFLATSILSAQLQASHALIGPFATKAAQPSVKADPSFEPPVVDAFDEDALRDTAARMQRSLIPVSSEVTSNQEVGISYVHWPSTKPTQPFAKKSLPVILIHGFDSSCLEYRRLGSRLADEGIDTYAVDILGWGFTQLENVDSFSASAKIESLRSFMSTILGPDQPFVLAGSSLGGAAAIEVAAADPNCQGLVLLDAQGFVDGIGPMASLPKPIAKLGVGVLQSWPLRSSANQMSYFDTKTYATEEAIAVGRLHCVRDGWSDAMVNFMQSGGFSPSAKVPTIQAPALVVWGRQDGILDGDEFANKFIETLPNAVKEIKWIDECGHVPHLEQPTQTAETIANFVKTV